MLKTDNQKSRVYRTNLRMFFLRFSTFFVMLFLVAISFGMFWGTKILAELDVAIFKILLFLGAGLFIFAVVATLYQFIFSLVRYFGTFIKITSNGIEYQNWPYYGIICAWENLERIEKQKKYGFDIDVLIPNSVQYVGKGTFLGINFRKKLGIKEQTYIPLSGFSGWPNGQLFQALKQTAGHLFETK